MFMPSVETWLLELRVRYARIYTAYLDFYPWGDYQTFDIAYYTPYAPGRTLKLVVPVYRADGSLGYCEYGTNGVTQYVMPDDELTGDADQPAIAMGHTLLTYYSDTVDLRRYRDLAGICRCHLSASSEYSREMAGYALRDYLVEHDYATDM